MTGPAGPSRVICTIATGPHRALWDVTRPTFERYAVRHGYHLDCRSELPEVGGRPPAWAKLPLILEHLERHDLVVWVDADVVVVDPERDIAADARGRHAIHAVTHVIDGRHVPNAGVLVIRRAPHVRRLFEQAWHLVEYLHHPWWENAALIAALGGDADAGLVGDRQRRRARRVLGTLPKSWNSVAPDPARDPAFVHFAGLPLDERLAGMRRLVAAVQERESSRRVGVRPANTAPKLPSTSTTTWVGALV